MGTDGSVDEVLSLLNDPRRRKILYCLLSNEYTDRDSLALQVAAWEQNVTLASVTKDASESVKVSLHHKHLPKLVESGIIEYDRRSGDVVRGATFNELVPFVQQLRASEEEVGRTDSGMETPDSAESEPFPGL